ncbi:MAG: acetylhydrolase [Longicatena sp.]
MNAVIAGEIDHNEIHPFVSKKQKAIYAMIPYYHRAVILGDSVAESILDFRLLRKNNVIAKRGRCVDQSDGDVLTAISYQPKYVFMEYGKNDITHFSGNHEAFIKAYTKQISLILRTVPKVQIFVNSIIPMRHDIVEIIGGVEVFECFNEGLKRMCVELGVGFIDNSELLDWDEDVYEFDGIHPKYPYYPKWLKHMVEVAQIEASEE